METNLEKEIENLRLDTDISISDLAERATGLENQLSHLEEVVAQLNSKVELSCKHEPISLDGKSPFYIVAIIDERKMGVIHPGSTPPLVFAIAICKHCQQTFIAIDNINDPDEPPLRKRTNLGLIK